MDGTHGFGYGVTGAQLRTLVAARNLCLGCVGTGRQWCVHSRASVPCSLCCGGAIAPHATRAFAPVAEFGARVARTVETVAALAAD